jgi:ABC-type spermidine/putrescine transport system permease subunit II
MTGSRGLMVATVLVMGVFLVGPTLLVPWFSVSQNELLIYPPTGFTTHWYTEFAADGSWTGALLRSLLFASISASAATLFGTLAAWRLARMNSLVVNVVRAASVSVLVMPPVVLAVGSFIAYSNVRLYGNPIALILTYTALGLPFPILLGDVALRRIDRNLELAARGLGAGPARVAIHVIVPLLAPTMLTAWGLAFLTAFDEVVITSFILPQGTGTTFAIQLFAQLQQGLTPVIAAASGVVIAIAFVAAGAGGWRYVAQQVRAR